MKLIRSFCIYPSGQTLALCFTISPVGARFMQEWWSFGFICPGMTFQSPRLMCASNFLHFPLMKSSLSLVFIAVQKVRVPLSMFFLAA